MTTTSAKQPNKKLDYKSAGVDIDAGNRFVEMIKNYTKQTHRPGVMADLGGFGALFELPLNDYQQPILVSGTDGVGTKLKLAQMLDKHDTIGIDLVAMCVNDILTLGAEPLFFLDYLATGKLEPEQASLVVKGISEGCQLAGCALIGGETAEMPGMYQGDDYDLAGFCVGIVEKSNIIDGKQINPGDSLIALSSSGSHATGYSLIRKIIDIEKLELSQSLGNKNLGEQLLEPTRIYVKIILDLIKKHTVLGMAHITGGGLMENLPRILPSHCQAVINSHSWQLPELFQLLKDAGNIDDTEMRRTFNCGVGMVLCLPANEAEATLATLKQMDEPAWQMGSIVERKNPAIAIEYL